MLGSGVSAGTEGESHAEDKGDEECEDASARYSHVEHLPKRDLFD